MIPNYFMQAFVLFVFIGLCIRGALILWNNHKADNSSPVTPAADRDTSNLFGTDDAGVRIFNRYEAHHALDRSLIHRIQTRTKRARAELEESEIAVCKLLGIERCDGSHLYDDVVNAIYDGTNWDRVLSAYNIKHYGARWPDHSHYAPFTM